MRQFVLFGLQRLDANRAVHVEADYRYTLSRKIRPPLRTVAQGLLFAITDLLITQSSGEKRAMGTEATDKKNKISELIPWRPFPGMPRWQQEMERRFGQFFDGRILSIKNEPGRAERELTVQEPEIKLYEGKDAIIIKAELPRLTKNNIQMKIVNRLLTIEGEKRAQDEIKEESYRGSERTSSRFARTIKLPADVKLEQVKAILQDGVLTIHLPKSEVAGQKKVKVRID
jgi:HSP20 family protein